jgi:hypothetical protein
MSGKDGFVQKVRETGHERVPEMVQVCAKMHFLGENVSRINFPRNMLNLKSLVLHPFVNRVFAKLNVSGSLQGHVV